MEIQRLLTSFSTRILTQFGVVILAAVVLIVYHFDVIYPFYAEGQLTNTGIVINSGIVLLFLLGIGNIFYNLLRYRREEAAIASFLNNVETQNSDYLRRRARRLDYLATPRHHAHHSKCQR